MTGLENLKGKIIVIGDSGVGKTTLCMCQMKRSTNDVQANTFAAAFFAYLCNVEGQEINLEIWDTAGQEHYQNIARAFYRNANCALIIFDVTSEVSFGNLNVWCKAVTEELQDKCSIIIVANKVDAESRVIPRDKYVSKAKQINGYLVETSALNGTNVDKLFHLAAKVILKKKCDEICFLSIANKKSRGNELKIIKINRSEAIQLWNPSNPNDENEDSCKCCFFNN